MSVYQEKITRHTKRQETQFDQTEQTFKPHSVVMELSDWEFKTIMTNMLRTPRDTGENMQEYMGNVSGEMEIL